MVNPTIKNGSTGAAVKQAQQALYCRSYFSSPSADGVFGPVTTDRVLQYQRDRAVGIHNATSFTLTVDGIVGPQTWFRLFPDQIQKKSKGQVVRFLQEFLKGRDFPPYDPGLIDGDFGPVTEKAVKAFQGNHFVYDASQPLVVDGIVGPKTWCAMWS